MVEQTFKMLENGMLNRCWLGFFNLFIASITLL